MADNDCNLGSLPQLHPRELTCREAEHDLASTLLEWQKRHDLTAAELLSIIQRGCSDVAQTVLKYAIRLERHGDTDKPGGLV